MAPLFSLVLLLGLAFLLLSTPAVGAGHAELKVEVQALLDQAAAGFDQGDVQAAVAISAPGSTIHYRDGSALDMVQWAKGAGADMADWRDAKTTFVVERAWPLGPDQAGAVYSERHEFARASDPGHRHAIAAQFEAVLVKTPKGWRIQKFIERDIKLLRDGKELAPQSAPSQ